MENQQYYNTVWPYMDNFLYSRNSLKYQGLDIQDPVVRRPIIANLDFNLHRAKKVVSDSPGLVDIAIGLVNSVLNLPNVQVKFFLEFKLQKNCEIKSAHQDPFGASWNDVWASKC